ncbi:MAG: universal stress protein, partial [Methanotrichaceae archaeon]|nr:universal stress protein [Methanotrichaceae archaeon]
MFEKILVPTDFSAYAHKILDCVGDIPGVKEVVLLNVVARPLLTRFWDPVAEVEDAERKLAEEKKYIKVPEIDVKPMIVSVLEREIAGAIQRVANEENVSLVVMGARGLSLIQSALMGSVSRNVLRFGDRHLLIMRFKAVRGNESLQFFTEQRSIRGENPRMEKFSGNLFSRVLIPTDFSQAAEGVISFIKSISGIAELVLLHAVSKGDTQMEIDAYVKNATKMLEGISQELNKKGLKVTTRVVVGNPVEQIRIFAEEADVSLIAMSSVGKDTMHVGRIGSRTYDVANTAYRPVLILRMKPVFV